MGIELEAVRRRCRWLRLASAVFVSAVLLLYVVTWCLPGVAAHLGQRHFVVLIAGLSVDALSTLSIGQRLLVAAVSVPYLVAFVWAFVRLDRMLRAFAAGDFFTRETVADLRAFSGLLLLAKLLSLLAMHVRVPLVHHLAIVPPRNVSLVNLSSDDLAVLLMCGLFFVIARTMEEGRRLAEENREFV